MVTIQKIKDHLKNIIEPESKKDIVSLGFIKNIEVEDAKATITTTSQRFAQNIKDNIHKLEGINEVHVTLKEPTKQPITPQPIQGVKHIIAVSSCKGGVGKSTLAVCIAQELQKQGLSVGLLDADIYGPSIPTLLDIHKADIKSTPAGKIIPIEHKGLKILSFGFLLKENAAILRGPIVSRYIHQLFFMTEWGKLDYLIVDLPPGTGDVHLTITHNIKMEGAIVVTTPHTLAIEDVKRGIKMFNRMNIPVTGIIENMAYFTDDTGRQHHLFGNAYGKKLEEMFNVPLLAQIPVDQTLSNVSHTSQSHEAIRQVVDKILTTKAL